MKTLTIHAENFFSDLELLNMFFVESKHNELAAARRETQESTASETIPVLEGQPGTSERIEHYRKLAELELPLC